MKKYLFIFTFIVLSSALAFSQNYVWAKSMGGTNDDHSNTLLIDASGNLFISGYFSGTADFDPSVGVATLTANGQIDVFIAKYDNAGNYLWAINMGGNSDEYIYSMQQDASGNIYVTGAYEGVADFDPGAATNNLTSNGQLDIFIAKYDNNGNYVWAKTIGGTADDVGRALQLDAGGTIYLTGYYYGTVDFNPAAGIANLVSNGNFLDAFILKLNNTGNYISAQSFGGPGNDIGNSLQLDFLGNVYVAGTFQGTADFDPGAGTANLTSNGGLSDIFIAKYTGALAYAWANGMGGSGDDVAGALQVETGGNCYLTGAFQFTVDFDPGAGTANLNSAGLKDIFISKYDNNGVYVWAKNIGSTGNDVSNNLYLDQAGDLYLIGPFNGTIDFDPSANTNNLSANGVQDTYIAKYNGAGGFIKALNIGNPGSNTYAYGIQTDGSDNLYLTGNFLGYVDFDLGANYKFLSSFSQYDIFILKYDNVPIGIKELNGTENNLSIYPNPNNGLFFINGINANHKFSIELIDVTGTLLFQKNIETNNQLIDLGNYNKGLYLLKIYRGGDLIATKKLCLNNN
jgi:hypothetical protein